MIAIGILGVGLLFVAMAFPVGLQQTRQAIEMSVSEAVYEQAIEQLQNQVTATGLETYLANEAPGTYRLGASNIWWIDFDETWDPGSGPIPHFTLTNADCAFSDDDTYGWLAAVEPVAGRTRCYRFWVFVVREPRGFISGGNPVGQLTLDTVAPVGAPTVRQLNFTADAPFAGTVFLADDGAVYRITELNTAETIAVCDRDVTAVTNSIAYPAGAGLTRAVPTVRVYQRVITY